MTIKALLLCGVSTTLLLLCSAVGAQTWSTASLTETQVAYGGPGGYYTSLISIRGGQNNVSFYYGAESHLGTRVCARAGTSACPDSGPWTNLPNYNVAHTGGDKWTVPTLSPGEYKVRTQWTRINGQRFDRYYRMVVLPPASARWTDPTGNSMTLWSGAAPAGDKAFFIVEGIDGSNESFENDYYALASNIANDARTTGTDIYILNFKDGGADLEANAAHVESAVKFVSGRRASGGILDVGGVSMGGVVTRIALAKAEAAGRTHGVRTFLSIDAPQRGAVLDRGLVDYIYNKRSTINPPKNLTSTAGRQLLRYNRFASANEHSNFFNRINGFNGDGYPNQSRNVGISLSNGQSNPGSGLEWYSIDASTIVGGGISTSFYVTGDVDQPGSYLPLESTEVVGIAFYGLATYQGVRKSGRNPAFIPYESAIDRSGGTSKFDKTITASATSFHDVLPNDVADKILAELGITRPPPPAVLPAPTNLRLAQITGTGNPQLSWNAPSRAPSSYKVYRRMQTGGAEQMIKSTTSRSYTDTSLNLGDLGANNGATYTVTAVYSDGESPRSNEVYAFVNTTNAATNAAPNVPAVAGPASISATVPAVFAVAGVYPNPVLGQARLGVDLPEGGHVRALVYDVTGRVVLTVVDGDQPAGHHAFAVDSRALSAGVYVYRVDASGTTASGTFTVAR